MDAEALTIGFARRFVPYKRPMLILSDPERLFRLVTNQDRPVQIIFAGKAHPDDRTGKELIHRIVAFGGQHKLSHRIVFLEDYDMAIARHLVHGADVWLNTPRHPREACGTSGMKASANGVLNMSVLDGWWPEAYRPGIGWAIGDVEEYEDPGQQDEVDSKSVYDLLEQEIIPLFYDRDGDGLPREWIRRMKAAMRVVCPMFNSARMVREYYKDYYAPAAEQYRHIVTRWNNRR